MGKRKEAEKKKKKTIFLSNIFYREHINRWKHIKF